MATILRRCLLLAGLLMITGLAAPDGAEAQSCRPGTELDGALCYPTCDQGYYGVGPVCWAYCRGGYDDHGATCYSSLFDWYLKSTYGRGVGEVPDWSPVVDVVIDGGNDLAEGIWEVGQSAYDAGMGFVHDLSQLNWCSVGSELSRGASSVVGLLGQVSGELEAAQTQFLQSVGLPSETVSTQDVIGMFQPDLDNLLRPILNADPQFGSMLVRLLETGRDMQVAPEAVLAAVCGDAGTREALRAAAAMVAQGGGGYVGESAAAPGWLGFVHTVVDVGGGLPANLQLSYGVLFKLAGDEAALPYFSGGAGVMKGGGVSSSMRLVYIPFDVSRADLVGHGWSLSGTGLLERVFTGSVGPWFSGEMSRGLALPIEVFGSVNVGGDNYVGFSFGPQIGFSTAADITLAYTNTVDLEPRGR